MSLVYIRNAAGTAWIPISYDAGAVEDHVKAQRDTDSVWRGITGVSQASLTSARSIRDAANNSWIPLDEEALPPPTIVGVMTRTSNSNQFRIYPHGNAQIGDLVIAGMGQRTSSSVTFSSGTATVLWDFKNSNLLAQPCIAAAIHDGSTYYTAQSSNFNAQTIMSVTVRGATANFGNLTIGSSYYSPSSQSKHVNSHNTPANSLNLLWIIEEYINGVPYTYNSGVWAKHSEISPSSSYNDIMVADYTSVAGGATGTGAWTGLSSSNAGYTSQTIGIPPP